MTLDVERYLGAVTRSVAVLERDGRPARAVTMQRCYDTGIDDLWDALTSAERIPRWFMPVSGDLKLGGRYQLHGNAGGTIVGCEPPKKLALTWEWGSDVSWVDALLVPEASDRTRLTLVHTAAVTDHWTKYGPGATGVGWEHGLLGLALHLSQPDAPKLDEDSFALSPEGKAFVRGSSDGWGRAAIASGEDPAHALEAAENTRAFYTGETQPGA